MGKMAEIIFVAGTRPELLKIGPVVAELAELGQKPLVVLTGQHEDLIRDCPAFESIQRFTQIPRNQSGTTSISGRLDHYSGQLEKMFAALQPRIVVVQGDTLSAMAGAEAASRFASIMLAHIEAGVRSFDRANPWPEEELRSEITKLSHLHFATTENNQHNLLLDHVRAEAIVLSGSPVVSALARYAGRLKRASPERSILITLHRRELLESPQVTEVVRALLDEARLHADYEFVWPAHPHLMKMVGGRVWDYIPENLQLVQPLGYRAMIEKLAHAKGVLTDSGGLVEEACTLGVPSVTARFATDRPEAVWAGNSVLVDPTPIGVRNGVQKLVNGEINARPLPVYGCADAAMTIAYKLEDVVVNLKPREEALV